MVQVWKIVGRNTPIYSFHVHSYCMLPDCRVLEWMSTRTFPHFETLLLGTNDEAIAEIKSTGIKYFFYSKELGVKGLGITTPIVAAPIFAPDQIGRYFGIKWTDGTSYLLTWRDQSAEPLNEDFLEAYREQVGPKPYGYFLAKLWRPVFAMYRKWGLHPYRLPWCPTCPGLDLPGG